METASSATPLRRTRRTPTPPRARTVSVRVSDSFNAQDTATVTITPGDTPPVPVISTPPPTLTWRVDDTISFSGSASDQEQGPLPPSALTWKYETVDCPTVDTCTTEPGETFAGVASGSFVAQNPESYPSHLRLSLTATDSGGLSKTTFVDLYPQTSKLTLASDPAGATLALGSTSGAAPFSTTVVTDGLQSISAPDQTIGGQAYVFAGWSDGGAPSTTSSSPVIPPSPRRLPPRPHKTCTKPEGTVVTAAEPVQPSPYGIPGGIGRRNEADGRRRLNGGVAGAD